MGKKADALREDLDITEAELRAEMKENATLRQVIADLAAKQGIPVTVFDRHGQAIVSVAGGAPTGVLAPQVVLAPDRPPTALAITHGEHQLGPDGSLVPAEDPAVADARAAIAELVMPSGRPEPTESLEDIVRRNNWERQTLHDNQRVSNALISRVASALQVTKWDADGTEILEKAQRFSVFVHFLSKRLKALVTLNGNGGAGSDPDNDLVDRTRGQQRQAVIDELRTIISALVAPPAVSKFLHEKSPPRVTQGIFDTALEPEAQVGDLTRSDVLALRDAWAVYAAERGGTPNRVDWLLSLVKSEVAVKEFVEIVNILLVPTLNRLKLATTP